MKFSQILISIVLIILLVAVNQFPFGAGGNFGGLSYVGWASLGIFLIGVGFVVVVGDLAKTFRFLSRRDTSVLPTPVRVLTPAELDELKIKRYKGPEYPHPVIFTDRCIGCHSCVDACPHDVLDIVDGRAAVIAADQCMEDTSCQVVCPVNPKACIVINTAKEIRSQPAPTRDAASYETNVKGCYIIGDVSGVPLIKNAVKEGAEVMEHIAAELADAKPEPKADFDVAVIGIGPGGASAVLTAHEKNLRFVGIEQDQILSTIASYPKGKYIFFKPDSTDWRGGLKVAGLGLSKGKYDEDAATNPADETFENALGAELGNLSRTQSEILLDELSKEIPAQLHADLAPHLEEKTRVEIKRQLKNYLTEKAKAGANHPAESWREFYKTHFAALEKSKQDEILNVIRREIADVLQRKIPGDQRERILEIWLGRLAEKKIAINGFESCKAIKRADNGDYFTINTERGAAKEKQTYTARRVVIAIGLRGSPNKLRLPNEDTVKVTIDGKQENKILYSLSNPNLYKRRNIIVVGGGNSAVEAAVDLVAHRDGSNITPRPPDETNRVTLLVRTYLMTNVKFGNKLQLYQCLDDGLLDVKFEAAIREINEREVVVEETESKKIIETIPNDYIFALIGGERPDRFLQSIGIEISRS